MDSRRSADHSCWRSIARFHARRLGLSHEDTEDCTQEFVLRMLQHPGWSPMAQTGMLPVCWLHRCARNHSLNYRRSLKRLAHHEYPWPTVQGETTHPDLLALPHPGATPEMVMMNLECRMILLESIRQLPCVTQQLFLRRYLGGESVQALALAFGKTPNAVEQILHRARLRLRKLLQGQGYVESGLRGELARSG